VFIRYLPACNIEEVVCCFIESIIGGLNFLKSTQLLSVNRVTDGLPAMCLSVNLAEPGFMELPPMSKSEGIINALTLTRYLVRVADLGFATNAPAYKWYILDNEAARLSLHKVTHWIEAQGKDRTIFNDNKPSILSVSVLVVVELFSVFTAPSEREPILVMPPWRNL
jgi:magnesium-transporting ATPase (P-type)